MTIYYYSLSGNSKRVAEALGGTLKDVRQALREGACACKDDAIGLVFPVHAGGAPFAVRRFVKRAKWEAGYVFAVATHSGGPGKALEKLARLAEKCGTRFQYTADIVGKDPGIKLAEIIKTVRGR